LLGPATKELVAKAFDDSGEKLVMNKKSNEEAISLAQSTESSTIADRSAQQGQVDALKAVIEAAQAELEQEKIS
jgi:hypothetical protein